MAQVSRTLTVIAILAFAIQVVYADVYVNFSNGNDTASGTISDPYKTLRRALNSEDSTIYLAGVTGLTEDCTLGISKSVKIISEGAVMNCRGGQLELRGPNNEFTLDGFNSLASLQVSSAMRATISNSIFHGLEIDNAVTTSLFNVSLSGPTRFIFSDSSSLGEVSLSRVLSSWPGDSGFYFFNADAQLDDVTCTKITNCIVATQSTLVAHHISYTAKGGIVGVKANDSSIEIHDSTFSGLVQAIKVIGTNSAQSKSSLQVYHSVFSDNGFNGYGGDIGSRSSYVFVEENRFYNSAALYGGSIHQEGGQSLIARHNIWSNSTAFNYGAVAFRHGDGKSEFVGNHVDSPYCGNYEQFHGYVFDLTSGCLVGNNTYCNVPFAHWPEHVVRPCSSPSKDDEKCRPDPPVTTTVTSTVATTGASTTDSSTAETTSAATSSALSTSSSGSSTTGSGSNTGRYTGLLIISLVVCLGIIAVLVVVIAKLTVCSKYSPSRLYEPIA